MLSSDSEVKDFINLGVVLNGKGEVLMIRRRNKETGKNSAVLEWAFPGGKQRLQETREQCVKREILDETGYNVDSVRQISLRMHPEFRVFVVYHLCRLATAKPISDPKEAHEVAEIKWVSREDVKKIISSNLDEKVAKELGLE